MPSAAPAAAPAAAAEETEAVRLCKSGRGQRVEVSDGRTCLGEAEGEDDVQRQARGVRRGREAQDHP